MNENSSAQAYVSDPRNKDVLIYVNGDLVPREKAVVSVFDSGFVLGDGVWEGLRVKNGRIIQLDAHLDRLFEGAGSIALDVGHDREALKTAIQNTLDANSMGDGVHIRLMLSRGMKSTPNQDPRFLIGGATLVIVAEYKAPKPESKAKGLALFTSTFRTSGPDVFDLRLNSHSRLNLIQALIQAINAGADEALMLDPRGFVASCNSTNFFAVRGREIWTSTGSYCFKGLTRKAAIDSWRGAGEIAVEKDFTLAEIYAADEAFITGTLGGITPVVKIDGRTIGTGRPGPVTAAVDEAYQRWVS
ncbi:MAG: aminotransferase class IV [Mesorhizobium sp.]|nr:aminotransferase class IV [Mesorhizobium sp.]